MSLTAAELMVRVGADTSAAERNLRGFGQRVGGLLRGVTGAASGAAGALGGMFTVAGGMLLAQQIAGIAGAVQGLGAEALESYATFERLGMSLQRMSANELRTAGVTTNLNTAMAMSAGRAKELQGWIEKLGVNSPFTSDDIASGFRLAMAYGFTSEQAKRLMQATVDFSAGSGATSEAVNRISLALGQMQARGKVTSQELNQLSEAGLNVRDILSKAFGVSTAQLMEMVEKGLVPADAAIEAIARSMEEDFGGAAKEQAGTFSGLMSSMEELRTVNLRDYFTGTFQAAQPYIQKVVDLLSNPSVRANIRAWGDDLGTKIGGGLKAASEGAKKFMAAFGSAGGGVGGLVQGVRAALNLDEIARNVQMWFDEADWSALGASGSTWLGNLVAAVGGFLAGVDWGGIGSSMLTLTGRLAEMVGGFLVGIDWGSIGNWLTVMTWRLSFEVGNRLKDIDWGQLWTTAATWTTDLAGNIGTKLSAIDWGGMWTTATTWTTDLAGNIGAKLSTIDWGGMWTTATTWTVDMTSAIGAQLALTDWGGLWAPAASWTSDLATAVGDKLAETDWSFGLAGMGEAKTKLDQGVIDWVTGQIQGIDWSVASIDLVAMVNALSEKIRSTDWSQVSSDFAKSLIGAFSGENMTANWKNLNAAVTEAIKSIEWLEIANAFSNLKSAVEEGIREAVIGAIGAALGAVGVGGLLNDIYGSNNGMYGKDESSPVSSSTVNIPGFGALPSDLSGRASGDPYWKGGTVLVGERGPELVNLPLGSQVVPNGKTMDFLRNLGIPGFAEGTPGAQPPAVWPGSSSFFGGDLSKVLGGVASDIKSAAKTMKEAAKDMVAAMSKTPGLFGTSKVTKDQMDMAALGVPQNFADDYLRQLTDEVLNGVDWAGVDIQEAAQRAGIDPKLPAEAILKMFAGAWNDSSLFADPKNLDLINMDAVQESLQRQQASDAGKANIQELLGLTAEEMLNQTAAMGSDILTGINAGMAGAAGADTAGTVIAAVGNSFELTEVIAHLAEVGGQWAREIYAGFQNTAAGLPWGSGVTGGATPPPTPPAGGANANGTPYWRGGATWVGERGPELVTLPTGARIFDASESRRLAGQGGGVTVVVNASVASDVDVEALAYRVAKVIKRRGA